jgi:UDP-N-acetylmuramoyl-L-alanyl-D-glutamate--2,6-diaminopimelate ligase
MMSLSQKWTMTLAALIENFVSLDNCPAVAVEGISLDSRQVQPGDLFIAIKGTEVDGTAYIPQAIDLGAVAVLVEKDQQVARLVDGLIDSAGASVPVIAVDNLREYVSDIAAVFYGQPSAKINLTGITGTNGKTTCSRLLAELMEMLSTSGSKPGSAGFVGTLGYGMVRDTGYQALHDAADRVADQPSAITETGLTTPDAVAMQRILAELASKGATDIAVEVSSHSLVQRRVAGVQFDTAVFTNLSRDHLDYHGDINAYAAAKSRLFAMQGLRNGVINIDDSVGRMILANLSPDIRSFSYSLENTEADIHCSTIGLSPEGLRASVVTPWGQGEISSPILGKFNLANLLAVIGAAGANGFDLADILAAIPNLRAVPGRMELVGVSTEPAVVVDYAHTPDALEKALQALRVHCQGNLWAVFGCGGDRDIGKRAEMGEIAERCADKVVVTSDNPRTESPDIIIEHILQGTSREVIVESDRRAAIRLAIGSADKNDVVLIAGKGHEDYQILGAQRLPFSDQAEARLALRDLEQKEAMSSSGGGQ